MNNSIFFFFYNLAHQSAFFDKLIVFTAVYLPYLVIFLAVIFLFERVNNKFDLPISNIIKNWRNFILVFFSAGLAVFFDLILKHLIHTPRPFLLFGNIHALFSETGYSFPSGHATFFGALSVAIFLLNKKAGYVFMFFALLIGWARIAAGVHFPIDILGGFILGTLTAVLINKISYFKKLV